MRFLLLVFSRPMMQDTAPGDGVSEFVQGRQESNPQPTVLETATLPIELLPYAKQRRTLLGFPVDHVTANEWIIFLQFEPSGIIAAVFLGDIHVSAFRAFHLDHNAIAFFRHLVVSFSDYLILVIKALNGG
jgi:hypothetical protein